MNALIEAILQWGIWFGAAVLALGAFGYWQGRVLFGWFTANPASKEHAERQQRNREWWIERLEQLSGEYPLGARYRRSLESLLRRLAGWLLPINSLLTTLWFFSTAVLVWAS